MSRARAHLPEFELLEGERLVLGVDDRGPTGGTWLIVRLAEGKHHAFVQLHVVTLEAGNGELFEIAMRQLRADVAAARAASL